MISNPKKMNLPNRLTVLRILLVPVFVLFMLWHSIPVAPLIALVIFAIASITDYIDGKIAREQNLVTDFGKFLDPMADKILVLSAMICMIPYGLCNPVVVIIVAAREFLVSSLRLVAASQGIVIAAGKSGKLKTASQMLSIVLILAFESVRSLSGFDIPMYTISNILMWLTAAVTVYSGGEYLLKNKSFIDPRQ